MKDEMGELSEQYLSFLKRGVELGRAEHLKLYA